MGLLHCQGLASSLELKTFMRWLLCAAKGWHIIHTWNAFVITVKWRLGSFASLPALDFRFFVTCFLMQSVCIIFKAADACSITELIHGER